VLRLRAVGTRRFGFGFVGQMTIDETAAAATARGEVFRLRVGFDDELRALAAWTSQEQWFHECFSGGSCVMSRKNRSIQRLAAPIEESSVSA
jgi:hypothetical protein